MTSAIIFDDRTARLSPLDDLRASFEIRTGARTTLERLAARSPARVASVAAGGDIAAVLRARSPFPVNQPAGDDDTLLISGRCVLPPEELASLPRNAVLLESFSDQVVAARVSGGAADAFIQGERLPRTLDPLACDARCLLHRPWDVIRFLDAALSMDLTDLAAHMPREHPQGVVALGAGPICVDPTATIYPTAVLDGEQGPIVVAAGATVRPGAVITGPAYIGEGSTAVDRAHVRANTAIGPVCKVGGEVGGTVFQAFSNKAHDGYLGDSWVGEWVNLGAATVGSNLLNTYGHVRSRLTPGEPREGTGLTFFGAAVGDHVKTAIGTRLLTGAIIGTGAMIAVSDFAPPVIPPFRWLTDRGEAIYDIERFLTVYARMAERRGVTPDKALIARLRALHADATAQQA